MCIEITLPNGTKEYRDADGELHRTDGPAYIAAERYEEWYQHGKLHREDGPAITHSDGSKEYWLNDNPFISEEQYKISLDKLLDQKLTVLSTGTKIYKDRNGEYHREDGPAIEFVSPEYSYQEWFYHGKLHRIGGPAIYDVIDPMDESDGFEIYEEWWVNGKAHRVDGPAILSTLDGTFGWWVNGEAHRIGGPAIRFENGDTHYYKNNKLHRTDGPAIVGGFLSSTLDEWWVEGKPRQFRNFIFKYLGI